MRLSEGRQIASELTKIEVVDDDIFLKEYGGPYTEVVFDIESGLDSTVVVVEVFPYKKWGDKTRVLQQMLLSDAELMLYETYAIAATICTLGNTTNG